MKNIYKYATSFMFLGVFLISPFFVHATSPIPFESLTEAQKISGLQAQIQLLTAQLNAILQQKGLTQTLTNSNVDLTIGSRGESVAELQVKLEAMGYLKMPFGVTRGYFGDLTKEAVIKLQKARNISPANGYVGAETRAFIKGFTIE